MTSPPTRAEWIEIEKDGLQIKVPVSPPTRAEWIEIGRPVPPAIIDSVSAHTGGVD